MGELFVNIHNFLSKRLLVSSILFVAVFLSAIFFIYNTKFKEDVGSVIPSDKRIDEISEVFNSSKFADRIIVNISLDDTSLVDAEVLVLAAQQLFDSISTDTTLIANIDFLVDESAFLNVYDFIYNNLPFYLSDEDYVAIDAFLNDSAIDEKIKAGYRSLISPTGIATKQYLFKDPLNIVTIAIKKLLNFQIDDNFITHNAHIFTKDKKHLLLFIDPSHPSSNTQESSKLVDLINGARNEVTTQFPTVKIEAYGGTVVAVENSRQVKRDIITTVSISILFLTLLFWFFFRRVRIIVFLFVPVLIGVTFSLVLLSLIVGEVSVISLGIGAILFGVSIDYSLHLFTHQKLTNSLVETIKKVSGPILLSSITTAAALLCIYVLKSEALKQFSLFATFGIIFSSLSALIILPFLSKNIKYPKENKTSKLFENLIKPDFHKSKILIAFIFLLSITLAFFVKDIKFNSDISSLNYQSAEVTRAEQNLNAISSEANRGVFIFSHAESLEKALIIAEANKPFIQSLAEQGFIKSSTGATDLIMSRKVQQEKIATWNRFWTLDKRQQVQESIIRVSSIYRFKNYAFNEFFDLMNTDFKVLELNEFELVTNTFLGNYINTAGNQYYVASVLKVSSENKTKLIDKLLSNKEILVFDKQLFINRLLEILKDDFNKLSMLSIVVVFVILLIFFGRIEIATITFVPIVIGWLWTLGLMGLLGIEFNIFNIIISSFIFGIGLDYSVFLVSGLIDDYKYGNKPITPYKLSIFIAALTTIGGFGVLIFAKHPAIKSIASVSIIGVLSVLFVSVTLTPVFFNALVNTKKSKRLQPIVLKNAIVSIGTFLVFIVGSLSMTLTLPLIYLIPLKKTHKRVLMCWLISSFSKLVVNINISIKRKYIDKHKLNFSKPAVIIANHQSHLDLVLILMLNPKIIVFTNKWVWNNIFYGFVIRYAEYFPAYKGIDDGFEQVRRKVSEGYSILIFPEGKRTLDGNINRFHQGAFSVAHELNIDIQPVMIHGAFDCLPKREFFLKSGHITLKFFDRITPRPEETDHGITFKQQTKDVTAIYRDEYALLKLQLETPGFFKSKLVHQYVYKGPVLEWYLRVKIKLEENYTFLNDIIPLKASIVDVGCGYGFLAYMLRMVSKNRTVLGIDYDEEKIAIANNAPAKDDGIGFKVMDLTEEDLPKAEVYIMNDVLHYMPEPIQVKLINQCIDILPDNGMLIIRDADSDLKERTRYTRLTEIQSTKIFKFNRTKYELAFVSGSLIKNLVADKGVTCEVYDKSRLTSNITYVIRKTARNE
ncbi:MAG: MMPL family transporter [Prolixibacteraceae bacterium]|nr:MMPL family transporter [Prolixibacteraceae bacterium]